jgi:hypothetical protein
MSDDMFEFDSAQLTKPKKKKQASLMPVIVAVGVVAAVGAVVWLTSASGLFAGRSGDGGQPVGLATEDQKGERRLTAFVQEFLLYYYNYSYTLYPDAVKKAEAMMTPEMQAAYNQYARDLTFRQLLESKRVSTDGFRIVPGSVKIGREAKAYYIQLSGTMTYTTGVNGASGDFPLNLVLAVLDTESGLKVDRVERLR